MSGYKTGNNANLYDEITGDLVGALGLNGQEQMLVTSKVNPLTGGGLNFPIRLWLHLMPLQPRGRECWSSFRRAM